MSTGVSFSPALVKMAKLSAPGLRFGSRGSRVCVSWPTCVLVLEVGEELPPVRSENNHIQFWNPNFSCKIRTSGNTGLRLFRITPKGRCVAVFRCKIQRLHRPLLSVYFLPGETSDLCPTRNSQNRREQTSLVLWRRLFQIKTLIPN